MTAAGFFEEVPDRESATGWRRWRERRHAFVSAPQLTLAEYRLLSPRDRAGHDLHRAATHANLAIQETPMSAAVSRVMWSRVQSNALKQRPTTRAGLMITGGGYQGKTETACEVAATFEDQWLQLHGHLNPDAIAGTRDLLAPVAYVQTPVTATPKSVCRAILDFYGADHRYMTLPELVHMVRVSLRDHATKLLILDDITRLKLHREADQDTLDLLRSLMSMHVTLVLIGVGIAQSGLLRAGSRTAHGRAGPPGSSFQEQAATQTERRFDLVSLEPFCYGTPSDIAAWVAHLVGMEQQVRLFRSAAGMLSNGVMPEYLFTRTAGIVGLLERLVEDGCAHAIESGSETLSCEVFDAVDISLTSEAGGTRTPSEVPVVPTRRGGVRVKKSRNTVFDDHGAAAPKAS